MDFGLAATLWTARVSAIFYVLALIRLWRKQRKSARMLWTFGLTIYLVHVGCAFTYFYGWSHSLARQETARQTAALFGVDWGGGLYLNYLFTGIWLADCIWWWTDEEGHQSRPTWIAASIHVFMAFMFGNGTIVVWLLK